MSDDLVERLRRIDTHDVATRNEAADHIEELTAERDALREALREVLEALREVLVKLTRVRVSTYEQWLALDPEDGGEAKQGPPLRVVGPRPFEWWDEDGNTDE